MDHQVSDFEALATLNGSAYNVIVVNSVFFFFF